MDELLALRQATAGFSRRLKEVAPDQWGAGTPCDEWSVRDVCDHTVGGNRYAVMLLDGVDSTMAMQRVRAGDFTGHPVGVFEISGAAQYQAFASGLGLTKLIGHATGPMSPLQFARLRILDLVIHSWDVARAIGGDDSLDHDLISISIDVLTETINRTGRGAFGGGASGSLDDSAPTQSRLLDLSGRRP